MLQYQSISVDSIRAVLRYAQVTIPISVMIWRVEFKPRPFGVHLLLVVLVRFGFDQLSRPVKAHEAIVICLTTVFANGLVHSLPIITPQATTQRIVKTTKDRASKGLLVLSGIRVAPL